jgi:hypothetical protein
VVSEHPLDCRPLVLGGPQVISHLDVGDGGVDPEVHRLLERRRKARRRTPPIRSILTSET